MGTIMSGRAHTSDQAKRLKGTFDPRYSAEAVIERKAAKVITGKFFSDIPVPTMPLSTVGLQEYKKLAQALLDQNRLTEVTQRQALLAAVAHQQISQNLERGKEVSSRLLDMMSKALAMLALADSAKNIAPPKKATETKWGLAGFANKKKA